MLGELQRAAGAAERIGELLQSTNEIQAPATGTVEIAERVSGRMELQDLRFSYPSRPDSYAIDGLNLTINPGETLALVGPSGAGKSTIFDLLLRFYDPQHGRILLEGHPLTDLDPMDLRRHFALVSESPALFFGSVEENIRYGNPPLPASKSKPLHASPMLTTSSCKCPTATRPTSVMAGWAFLVASASAWPSPARCWWTHQSCCWTKPPALWMRKVNT